MSEAISLIPFSRLHESPTNPRRMFGETAMAELVESIKAEGVLQPIVVRPVIHQLMGIDTEDAFEVVFGHRRYRAAQRAELGEMPCIVRAMSDAEAARAQLHENLARADVHPIEEAEGYSALMRDFGVTADQLVQQTGKSRSYIYGRLALLKACPSVRDSCLAGKIGSEVALLIARLRTTKLQEKALAAIASKYLSLTDGGQKSYRGIRDLLREKFTLSLKGASCLFDTADVFLVPDAGPCTTCPKRSGNAPEFVDVATGTDDVWGRESPAKPDLCTDPDCYAIKVKAHLANQAAALEAKGKTLVTGNAARAAIDAQGKVKGNFIPVDQAKAYLKQLPKTAAGTKPTADIVTIQDPRTGKTVEAVRRADLEQQGVKLNAPTSTKRGGQSEHSRADEAEQRKRQVEKAEIENRARRVVFDQVRARAAAAPRTELELRLITRHMVEALDYRDEQLLAEAWGEPTIAALAERMTSMGPDDLGRLLLDCALVVDFECNYWCVDNEPAALFEVAGQYGIDVDAARREAASTPSTAAHAPEGEGAARCAGADDGDLAAPRGDDDGSDDPEESRMDKAGCAGNADQTDEAGDAGQVQGGVLWPFPKRAD